MTTQTDTFSKWILGIAAIASVMYGGWIGNEITRVSDRLGSLEGRLKCGQGSEP